MECSYKLTESEVLKAIQVHAKPIKLFLLVLFGITLALVGILPNTENYALLFSILFAIAYFLAVFVMPSLEAKRLLKENRGFHGEVRLLFSEQSVGIKTETYECKLKWSDIHKWKYSDGIYLLYVTSNQFHIVPSRALEHENELSNLLRKYVSAQKA